MLLFNVGGISIFVLVIVQLFVIQRNQYQEQSDHLLLNILPREIADILRSENRVIADAFEEASILFADVVNFTPLSASMSPVELVNLLNEVFSHFDLLAEKHKLEKIKTIGDCYMVASGIPRARADHAQAVAYMALDILDYVKDRSFNGHTLAFRIGINSGPVIAGVIGQKKFAYDLWGDAVNTASRMESHGLSNVIQITRSTYELIQDEFICEPQKPVFVKGKGEMEVWYVLGTRKARS
jgi:guanylate cyclase